jgi:hypothetical protein
MLSRLVFKSQQNKQCQLTKKTKTKTVTGTISQNLLLIANVLTILFTLEKETARRVCSRKQWETDGKKHSLYLEGKENKASNENAASYTRRTCCHHNATAAREHKIRYKGKIHITENICLYIENNDIQQMHLNMFIRYTIYNVCVCVLL